jgi:hypothetical protein
MRSVLLVSLAAGLLALAAPGAKADDVLRLANVGDASVLRLDGLGDDADNVLVYRRGWGGYYGGYYRGWGGYYGGYRGYGWGGYYRPYYGWGSYYRPYYGWGGYYRPYYYSSYYYGCAADLSSMPAVTRLGTAPAPRTEPYSTHPYDGDPQVVPPAARSAQPVVPRDGLLVSSKGDASYQFLAYGENNAPARLPATSGGFMRAQSTPSDAIRIALPAATTGGVIGIIER